MKFYILLWLRELWIFVYFEQVICHWSGRSTIHVWWWTGILYCGAGCVFVRPLKFCAKTDGLYSISSSSVFCSVSSEVSSCLHLRYPFLSSLLLLYTKNWAIKSWIFKNIQKYSSLSHGVTLLHRIVLRKYSSEKHQCKIICELDRLTLTKELVDTW